MSTLAYPLPALDSFMSMLTHSSGLSRASFFAPGPAAPGQPPWTSSSPVSSFRRTRPPPTAAAMYQVLNDAVTPATIIIMPGSIETKCIQADPLPVITMMISMAIKATP